MCKRDNKLRYSLSKVYKSNLVNNVLISSEMSWFEVGSKIWYPIDTCISPPWSANIRLFMSALKEKHYMYKV